MIAAARGGKDVPRPARPTSVTDLVAMIGVELGPTGWHTMAQADIDGFAYLTGDHQWIHVDAERAADGPFGGTIGHGLFTLALGPTFLEELMSFDGFAHSLNYGYDRVRFISPRLVGTRVRMRASITAVTPDDRGSARVTTVQTFEGEGSDRPICMAESIAHFTMHESPKDPNVP